MHKHLICEGISGCSWKESSIFFFFFVFAFSKPSAGLADPGTIFSLN